jgi:hypothetical protein
MTLIGSYELRFHRLPENLIRFSFSYDRGVVVKAFNKRRTYEKNLLTFVARHCIGY